MPSTDPFHPDPAERLARARGDLRMGLPVILTGGGEAVLALAAEGLGEKRLAALRAVGAPVLAITARRAQTLKAAAYDGDLARVTVPPGAGADWIRAVADPADDLRRPLKGPLVALRGGAAGLARLALGLAKSARLLPAVVICALPRPLVFAQEHDLVLIAAEDGAEALLREPGLVPVVAARVPMALGGAGRLHVFRPDDGSDEHHAVEIGRPARDAPVLVRLHSACFTGDVLGSLKCDCGPQLRAALARMGEAGEGVLLYLSQEGRGIGLANKMRAYSLQDQGFDTVEANHRLGFEDDERDFRLGAAILRGMGFARVRLMTNNPAKVRMMESHGIEVVERVPLRAGRGALNEAYLATKAAKSGHLL